MDNLMNHLDTIKRLPAATERRRLREQQRVTQRQIGEELGVTSQAVAAWERGLTPSAEHLAGYVRLLDLLRERGDQIEETK